MTAAAEAPDLWLQFFSNLGAFTPFAVLAFWVMWNQTKQIETERARNAALTDRVIVLAQSGEKTIGELTAAVRAANNRGA